jgi:hypothetical protein
VWAVPVEFLSDQEAAAFGRYVGSVSRADLERFFFLDDRDREPWLGCGEITTGSGSVFNWPRFVISGSSWRIRSTGYRPRPSTFWPASCRSLTHRV